MYIAGAKLAPRSARTIGASQHSQRSSSHGVQAVGQLLKFVGLVASKREDLPQGVDARVGAAGHAGLDGLSEIAT